MPTYPGLSSRASQRLLIAGSPLRPQGNPLGVAHGVVTLDDEDGRAQAARQI